MAKQEVGKTIGDIVQEYLPGATEADSDYVVWEKTGFPYFWNIPEDGNTPEECLRKQLQDYAEGFWRCLS